MRGSKAARARGRTAVILVFISIALFFLPERYSETLKLNAVSILSPVRSVSDSIRRFFTRTAPDPTLARENDFLKKRLSSEMLRSRQLESELGALRRLEEFNYDKEFEILFADVIVAGDSTPARQSLVIAKGTSHGIRPGMLVVYQQYLVGRVHQVAARTSRVMLCTDPAFKIGAVAVSIEAQELPRQVGLAQGAGPNRLSLRWMSQGEAVRQGQFVTTTLDPAGGVPKGLVVGRVVSLERTRGPYPTVHVESAVESRSLEYVMLLSPKGIR
jgi:rod shape-determining protein MreC